MSDKKKSSSKLSQFTQNIFSATRNLFVQQISSKTIIEKYDKLKAKQFLTFFS